MLTPPVAPSPASVFNCRSRISITLKLFVKQFMSVLPITTTRHGGYLISLTILALIFSWPALGGTLPPGVDTPTFLHLSWITKLAVTGELAHPAIDPYWYGGFPYLQAYSPLSYGAVGVASAITTLDIIIVYRIALVFSYLALGLSTYGAALSLGVRWWLSALGGILTMLSYPVLAAMFFWGWFSTAIALPIGLAAFVLLEHAAWRNKLNLAAIGGSLLGLSVLVHHMTAFAFCLGMIAWFLFHVTVRTFPFKRLVKVVAVYVGVAILISSLWAIPFLIHWMNVDFQRPVPGNWLFTLNEYRQVLLYNDNIGRFFYPSYFGAFLLPAGLMGVVYSLIAGKRYAGVGIMALVFLWFSLGTKGNVLYYYTPFSSLDVARFHYFSTPFLILGLCILINGVIDILKERWKPLVRPTIIWGATALFFSCFVAIFFMDAWKARGLVEPFQVEPQVEQALQWTSNLPIPDSPAEDRIFTLGFWNWGAFLIPYETGHHLADGWYDEGALNWRPVQRLRLMAFYAQGDAKAAHESLLELQAKYVLIYNWYPYQHPWVFQQAFEGSPELFKKHAQWGDGPMDNVIAFEVLESKEGN